MKSILFFALFSLYWNPIYLLAQSDQYISNYRNENKLIVLDDTGYRHKEVAFGASEMQSDARLINLKFTKNRDLITLENTRLIEDDAPATGVPEGYESYTRRKSVAWVEDLKRGIVLKKLLVVDDPRAASGRVVFKGFEVKGNTQPLYLSLNGEKFVRPASLLAYPHALQYINLGIDRWYYVDLPVEKLKKGENELLMWTESDSTSWRILIALNQEFKRGSLTRTSPNRSLKSNDGGKTWSDSQLGAMNSVDGEYSVRISLDQYLSEGEYISNLIDLAEGDTPLKRNINNISAAIWPEIEIPEQTSAKVFVRFGSTPFMGDQTWSEWQTLKSGEKRLLNEKRYLQLKMELATENPLITPKIYGLRFSTSWENKSPYTNSDLQVHVVSNGRIIPSSYPFKYENLLHPELKRYREINKLDQIIAGSTSEFEVMMRLLNWAYRVPLTLDKYSWNWNDVTIETASTPKTIGKGEGKNNLRKKNVNIENLGTVEHTNLDSSMPKLNGPFFKGRRMVGMCLYPNQALIGALLSMGFQARHINIHSEGASGHEVTEVWSNEFNKWIYMDATRDYYYFDYKTGVPLNLLEIHNLLVSVMPRVENWKRPFVPDIGKEVVSHIKVGMRQGYNPFSIKEDGTHILEIMGHFRIIPRNDFLSNPLPVPVHTGETMWGWDGFLNWYDSTFPKRDEYQRYTNRTSDFYQPLNQAKVFLNETNEVGFLKVMVDNFTPGGFGDLLVKMNDEDWQIQNNSSWIWKLKSGENNIEVRTRNVRGILGPVSRLQLMYNP